MAITLGAVQLAASRIREALASTLWMPSVDYGELTASGKGTNADEAVRLLNVTADYLEAHVESLRFVRDRHAKETRELDSYREAINGAGKLLRMLRDAGKPLDVRGIETEEIG